MVGDGLSVIFDRFKGRLDCDFSGAGDAQPQVALDIRHPKTPSAVLAVRNAIACSQSGL